MKKWLNRLLESSGYLKLISWLENTRITKDKVSLMSVLRMFGSQMKKNHIQERARGMAFSFIMSVFPGIIFFFTMIPYIPIPDLDLNIMSALESILPESIFIAAEDTIFDIVSNQNSGLLSFGFVFALYAANNGTLSMIDAFNRCYRTKENRTFIQRMLVSLGITSFVSILTLLAIGVTIFLKVYTVYLEKTLPAAEQFYIPMLYYARNLVLFLVFFISISFIYYQAPSVHKKWNFFSIGSSIAAIMIVLFTIAFSFYINNFSSYNKVYGSIGALIGLMLWFYFISIVLLIGFEINASIHRARHENMTVSD